MIGSIVGLLVMIALTTFMAALMQLSAEVLAPRNKSIEIYAQVEEVAKQYVNFFPNSQRPDQDKVEESIIECLANLPRDSSSTRTAC